MIELEVAPALLLERVRQQKTKESLRIISVIKG
jgi:hypothetical protein